MSAQIRFRHSAVGAHFKSQGKNPDLTISVKPDKVAWSYGLNTANFPTYGGEVVQILSVFIADIEMEGTIATYAELERIYEWFIVYLQLATQGNQGVGSYDMEPVEFALPNRGWMFDIYPKQLPGFRYGRDVVAPSWGLTAAIHQSAEDILPAVADYAKFKANNEIASNSIDISIFQDPTKNKVTLADIGFTPNNPFSGPTQGDNLQTNSQSLADYYQNLVSSYTQGDFSSLNAQFSKPAFLAGQTAPTIAVPSVTSSTQQP